ncbi:MAG: 16S rRNA (guanine(527)-N(7))-methyltransferase RsmG [Christensenellales bacterium]
MYEKLTKVLKEYTVEILDENVKKLCDFIELMLDYNKTHNITAITEENDIIFKHLLDSLLPINEIIKVTNNNGKVEHNKISLKILDIGCGAGFPSIPLCIANNNLNITAIDSVRKKIDFVNLVKNKLNLINLNALHTRIEDLAFKSEHRENYDIVTSRAVAPLNIILEYSAPMLKNHGYIFAYKGSNYKEEIDNAKNALRILNCEIEEIFEYNIKEINTTRYVLKIRKKSEISTKYPRKQNKPRLQPL